MKIYVFFTSSIGDSALVPLPLVAGAADLVATSSFCYDRKLKNKNVVNDDFFAINVKDIVLLIFIENKNNEVNAARHNVRERRNTFDSKTKPIWCTR